MDLKLCEMYFLKQEKWNECFCFMTNAINVAPREICVLCLLFSAPLLHSLSNMNPPNLLFTFSSFPSSSSKSFLLTSSAENLICHRELDNLLVKAAPVDIWLTLLDCLNLETFVALWEPFYILKSLHSLELLTTYLHVCLNFFVRQKWKHIGCQVSGIRVEQIIKSKILTKEGEVKQLSKED